MACTVTVKPSRLVTVRFDALTKKRLAKAERHTLEAALPVPQ
jgi:hypothetical protein